VARLREHGIALSPEDFFESPTIKGLNQIFERNSSAVARQRVTPKSASSEFPLAELTDEEVNALRSRFDHKPKGTA
jgi:hypothetical protein